MHIHLEPVGGVAGDMFVASLLDAFPELEAQLRTAFAAAELDSVCHISRAAHHDGILTGSQFCVTPNPQTHTHHTHEHHQHGEHSEHSEHGEHSHRHHSTIVDLFENATMPAGVRRRALDMFGHLARVEGRIHGIPISEVSFHEVGAWDSIADIWCAAFCIETLDATWSCTALPLGRGQVQTAHGTLPIPAPATARLLEGFPVFQDDIEGERVTPTGAAIIRHLNPSFEPMRTARTLTRSGYGFGTQRFDNLANTLRALVFESTHAHCSDTVGVCEFEIDDQSPEDLAIAIDNLRDRSGVLDISQATRFGKKGRIATHVRALVRPADIERFAGACLEETTSLGVRWQLVARHTLARAEGSVEHAGKTYRVKQAQRPHGTTTMKVEADELVSLDGGNAQREAVRRAVESKAYKANEEAPSDE